MGRVQIRKGERSRSEIVGQPQRRSVTTDDRGKRSRSEIVGQPQRKDDVDLHWTERSRSEIVGQPQLGHIAGSAMP